jgi:hypothetical protein
LKSEISVVYRLPFNWSGIIPLQQPERRRHEYEQPDYSEPNRRGFAAIHHSALSFSFLCHL